MKKRNLLFLLFTVIVLVVIGVLLLAVWGATGGFGGKKVPARVVLEVDLERGAVEYIPQDPFAQLTMESTPVVRDLVEALVRAAEDDRVVGLLAKVGNNGFGIAQLQEVRDAIGTFRAAGKKAVAFSETFGEFSPGNGSYYLASAFDQIYLQPSGDVNLTGLFLEAQFFRGTLDKLGIEPRMDQRHEYKNAMNSFTDTEFTPAFREAMQALMDSIFGQMVQHIAAARELEEESLRELIDRGPYLGQEAVDVGLVDGLAYRDEVYSRVLDEAGEGAELLFLDAYLERAGRPYAEGEVIALVYGVGGVARGSKSYDPLNGSMTMAADAVAANLRAAVEDEDVRAIVFRVDSPGGSYVASDSIWRETIRARDAGKPVVVTMGNVAASGGYFVSMDAAKIVAQPGTITGSIGVLGGKMLTAGLWQKVGISFDAVESSANADIYSASRDYDEGEWERFQAWLDRVYEDFTGKVAAGRQLPLETVREIARGRVWTGQDALAVGLVDALGGFPKALELARQEAGIGAEEDVHLRLFPRPKTTWQLIFDESPSSSQTTAIALARVLEDLQPAVRLAQRLGLVGSGPGVLELPPEMILEP